MAKFIVTGGAGFIGGHLCKLLEDEGHTVQVVDLKTGQDINDPTSLQTRRADVLIHLAALAGVRPSEEKPHEYLQTNIAGTHNVLDLAYRAEVSRVVLASSSSIYGKQSVELEDITPAPISLYAASKAAMENLAHAWHHKTRIPVDILRPFTVYGPRNRPDMLVGQVIHKLRNGGELTVYGTGVATRQFTFVGDVAEAFKLAAYDDSTGFRLLNVTSGANVAVSEVIGHLEDIAGGQVAIHYKDTNPADSPHNVSILNARPANATIKEALGWTPKVSIYDGLRQTWHDSCNSLLSPGP